MLERHISGTSPQLSHPRTHKTSSWEAGSSHAMSYCAGDKKGARLSWNNFYCTNKPSVRREGEMWSPAHVTEQFQGVQRFKASATGAATFPRSSANADQASRFPSAPGAGAASHAAHPAVQCPPTVLGSRAPYCTVPLEHSYTPEKAWSQLLTQTVLWALLTDHSQEIKMTPLTSPRCFIHQTHLIELQTSTCLRLLLLDLFYATLAFRWQVSSRHTAVKKV